jgi:hypothetical protein
LRARAAERATGRGYTRGASVADVSGFGASVPARAPRERSAGRGAETPQAIP